MAKFRTIDECQLLSEPAEGAQAIELTSAMNAFTWDREKDVETETPNIVDGFVFVKTSRGAGWVAMARLEAFVRPQVDRDAFIRACLAAEFDSNADPTTDPFYASADFVLARAFYATGISNTVAAAAGPDRFGPLAMRMIEWDFFLHNSPALGDFTQFGWNDPVEQVWAAMARMSHDARALAEADASAGRTAFGDGGPTLLDIFWAWLLDSAKTAHRVAAARAAAAGLPDTPTPEFLAQSMSLEEIARAFSAHPSVLGTAAKLRSLSECEDEARKLLDGALLQAYEAIAVTAPELKPAELVATSGAGSPDGGQLGRLVARGESGAKGYRAFNTGNAGDAGGLTIDFSAMTVAQLQERQSRPKGAADRIFAFGKYQLIPSTFAGAAKSLRLKAGDLLTDHRQEELFRQYLVKAKRPQISRFISGSGGLRSAQVALAREFAAVGMPDTGKSAYGGVGGNKASISPAEAATALEEERRRYRQAIDAGMSPDAAWASLSFAVGAMPTVVKPPEGAPATGMSKLDITKAVAFLVQNARIKSGNECAKFVRLALDAGGVKLTFPKGKIPENQKIGIGTDRDHWTDAKYYSVHLSKAGFVEIPGAAAEPPQKGDIAVVENVSGGHWAGHVCMFSGTRWVSDYAQLFGYYPNARYRAIRPPVRFFRP